MAMTGKHLLLLVTAWALLTPPSIAQPRYRGLSIGDATVADVIDHLGPPSIKTGHAEDLRYSVEGSPALHDRLYFQNGKLALVTAASVETQYRDRQSIERAFGKPEAQVLFQSQQYLDYTTKGLKFICDSSGATTGVISFQPRSRRVPADSPNADIDLRRQQLASDLDAEKHASRMRVGTAQLSIAPKSFADLLADGRGSQLTLAEDLLARVVVFERNGEKVVLAGLDVFGLGPWDISKLRRSLAEKGFPNVIVAMSHTHANVDTIGFYGHYPKKYAQHVVSQTEAAVLAADKSLAPVRNLRCGSVEMPLAGGRVIDLIRNGRDPGLVDPTVSVLQAIASDGRPIVNIVNLACHPEVIKIDRTKALSPDYVGALCQKVTVELGGQTVFLNGALGGMLTPDTRFRSAEAAREMGLKLAEFAITAAEGATVCRSDRLSCDTQSVDLPVDGEAVSAFLENAPGPVDFRNGRVKVDMSAVWIGDAQFITVPGELLPDIGFEFMEQMTGRLRSVVSLANGELGYLVPGFDFRDDGYEERTGPGKEAAQVIRRTGLKLAQQP